MFTARKKIVKEKGAEPDDFEESVAQVRAAATVSVVLISGALQCRSWKPEVMHPRVCLADLHTFMQALFDLEATNAELKADLRDLYITSAKEIDVHGTARKAIIVHVRCLGIEDCEQCAS
jgi:small subunit ribosomal protein S7e